MLVVFPRSLRALGSRRTDVRTFGLSASDLVGLWFCEGAASTITFVKSHHKVMGWEFTKVMVLAKMVIRQIGFFTWPGEE